MKNKIRDKTIFFLIGLVLGIGLVAMSWGSLYRIGKKIKVFNFTEAGKQLWLQTKLFPSKLRIYRWHIVEDFSKSIKSVSL